MNFERSGEKNKNMPSCGLEAMNEPLESRDCQPVQFRFLARS